MSHHRPISAERLTDLSGAITGKRTPLLKLEMFELRCWARAYLEKHGLMPLHEAVDGLQASAVSAGLVTMLGQDLIQKIMAEAFGPNRIRPC